MKILVVCGAGYISGLERVTLDLVRELARGHAVHCLTSTWGSGAFFRAAKDMGLPCTRLPLGFISKSLRRDAVLMTLDQGLRMPELIFGWLRLLRVFRPDAVLLSNMHHVALLRPFLPRDRCWFHVHNAWPETNFHRWMTRWLESGLNGFIAVSDFVRERLIRLGASEDKAYRVHNGVIVPDSDNRRSGPVREGCIVVGIAGQVGEWKGHEDLFRAISLARGLRPGLDFRLKVFGVAQGEFAARLRRLSTELGIEGLVEWMGFRDSAADIYGQMDICVVPSRYEEPFGLVAAEAGAWGLPVIATRRGGLPEIVEDGLTGFLVGAGAPDQIAVALCRLGDEPELCRALGSAARQRVTSEFNVERMACQIEGLMDARRGTQKTGSGA